MENQMNSGRKGLSAVTRVGAVIGFIAILALGMWGSVMIASAVPGAFSNIAAAIVSLTSIFVPAGETVTISVDPSLSIKSGDTVTLSWTHEKKSTEGSYTFRYDCADGVYFTSPSNTGSAQTVYCNTPFNFLNSGDKLTLTGYSTTNRFADVTVHVDYTPNGASKATVTGHATISIANESLATSPSTTATSTVPSTPATPSTPTTPKTPAVHNTPGSVTSNTYNITGGATASNPNGRVDLVPSILEVGVVDKTTGAFTASSTPSRSQRIAVRFAITNQGTKTSPQFDFAAVLPTLPSNIFNSPMQQALGPGDRIEFTIGFDSFDPNKPTNTFTVNVDPSGSINESNEDNNVVKYTIVTVP